jgi:uncharacterized membrane protein YdjX (TVP38/TMEM64 family)
MIWQVWMKSKLIAYVKTHKKTIVKAASVVLLIGALIWLTFQFAPFVNSLKDEVSREHFKQDIYQKGVMGWFTMLGIQILQVVVALIPGEPIEVLAGITYGTFGGLATCLIGSLIGTVAIFYAVRWLGHSLVQMFIENEKISKLKFLQNSKRLELITLILFFIPGTPKDVLTYVAGLTPIKPLRFFLISTFARIPSVITSTYAGSTLGEGHIWQFVIIYGVTAIVAVIGIIIYNKILKKMNRQDEENENKTSG